MCQNCVPFGTYTQDLFEVSRWLKECDVDTVAIESTGVLWIPLYEHLSEQGFDVCLVNAKHIKNVPGKKTDVLDCQWLQQLHTYGLLQGSFRPKEEMVQLRSLVRQRAMLIESRSRHIQHMHKALQQMNVRLDRAVSDVTGKTGMSIIRAIIDGEKNSRQLATFRDGRCRLSEEEIAKALEGNFRDDHLFALKQAVELYDFYTQKIVDCDIKIESRYAILHPEFHQDLPALPAAKKHNKVGNQPHFDLQSDLYQLCGVDLTAIEGVSTLTVQTVISEIGLDMSVWPTAAKFARWLGLAPNNQITGGKVIKRGTSKVTNRATQALRMAAQSVYRSDGPIGRFYRRIKRKHGPQVAITATAHKLARIIYALLKSKTPYQPQLLDDYEVKREKYRLHLLHKQAQKLGYDLTPIQS
ncbi:IS110 family transposase [Moorena sp. SIO3B2]|uniref:IS110 family transposase n=1 Tax=Moorena sp. SIO3B2 TaxID=2607827 RepID=UPI0013CA89FC|nr:IS110 family transposase [Moorena sp. SIO3B2]NEP37594.1 IS110 family transposase [Moorena sp. SIO3B2]